MEQAFRLGVVRGGGIFCGKINYHYIQCSLKNCLLLTAFVVGVWEGGCQSDHITKKINNFQIRSQIKEKKNHKSWRKMHNKINITKHIKTIKVRLILLFSHLMLHLKYIKYTGNGSVDQIIDLIQKKKNKKNKYIPSPPTPPFSNIHTLISHTFIVNLPGWVS